MPDRGQQPDTPPGRHREEYQDPHYHDDELFPLPSDEPDAQRGGPRQPRKRGRRKLLPPRRFRDD
jgi:hypothetical protein